MKKVIIGLLIVVGLAIVWLFMWPASEPVHEGGGQSTIEHNIKATTAEPAFIWCPPGSKCA